MRYHNFVFPKDLPYCLFFYKDIYLGSDATPDQIFIVLRKKIFKPIYSEYLIIAMIYLDFIIYIILPMFKTMRIWYDIGPTEVELGYELNLQWDMVIKYGISKEQLLRWLYFHKKIRFDLLLGSQIDQQLSLILVWDGHVWVFCVLPFIGDTFF